MADEKRSWAAKGIAERIDDVIGYIVGGVFALSFVAVLISIVVNETRWTFTTVTPNRVCANGQHSNCLQRMPGRVKLVDGSWFNATVDRAPYLRDATLSHGPAPAVGSAVVFEDWNRRLVSVFDPASGRRHTRQWPNPRKDIIEAAVALAFLLLVPVFFLVIWLLEVRRRRSGAVILT
jgi:hypothetical protein